MSQTKSIAGNFLTSNIKNMFIYFKKYLLSDYNVPSTLRSLRGASANKKVYMQ